VAPDLRVNTPLVREGRHLSDAAKDTIQRFRPSERHLHWAIAIPFIICFATAVVLVVVYNPNPTRPYREAFSLAHRVSGICLIVFPLLMVLRHRRDFRIHLYNVRQGWIWTINDIKWLCLMGLAAMSKRFELPEQGKFNAAEKMNFMMVMTFAPLLAVTGVLIWLPGADLVAWLAHMAMAALAAPLMLGHIFMATINPGTRVGLWGMISGRVDRRWAKHHYRAWYREQFEQGNGESRPTPPARAPQPEPLLLRCSGCGGQYELVSWENLLERVFSTEPASCPSCGIDLDDLEVVTQPQDLPRLLVELDRGRGAARGRGTDLSRAS